MMEKRNKVIEKEAAGDSRDLDDIVEMGAKRFSKPNVPRRRFERGVPVMPAPEYEKCR